MITLYYHFIYRNIWNHNLGQKLKYIHVQQRIKKKIPKTIPENGYLMKEISRSISVAKISIEFILKL
jgi:hypothetical protein